MLKTSEIYRKVPIPFSFISTFKYYYYYSFLCPSDVCRICMCFNSNLVFRGILHINEVYRWVQKPIVRHSKGETKTIFNSFEIKQWKLDLKNKVISWYEALEDDLSLFCHEVS